MCDGISMKKLALVALVALTMAWHAKSSPIVAAHDFYLFGKIFHCALNEQELTNTPVWKVGEPTPPLSPGAAVQKAKQYLARLNFEDLTWSGPSKISLIHEKG